MYKVVSVAKNVTICVENMGIQKKKPKKSLSTMSSCPYSVWFGTNRYKTSVF